MRLMHKGHAISFNLQSYSIASYKCALIYSLNGFQNFIKSITISVQQQTRSTHAEIVNVTRSAKRGLIVFPNYQV